MIILMKPKRRNTSETTPKTPRKKQVDKERRMSFQAQTPSNSTEKPRTRSRSGNQKEQQHQEESFNQNNVSDRRPGELITPKNTNKGQAKKVELQDLREQ